MKKFKCPMLKLTKGIPRFRVPKERKGEKMGRITLSLPLSVFRAVGAYQREYRKKTGEAISFAEVVRRKLSTG